MNARTTALSALIACRKEGAWADGVLKEYISRDRLDSRDAALASRLCYGVLQNRLLLDYYIQQCLKGPIKKLQPVVLDILRLGMYQILLMDKIPASAAVNEAVEQGKKYANARAAGLINGVLRHAVREKDRFRLPNDLSVRYSHPQELVDLLEQEASVDDLKGLLESHNTAPQTVIHLNPLVADPQDAISELQAYGVELETYPWLEHAYYVSGIGNLEAMPLFRNGGFLIQDPAAHLAVSVIGIKPGMHILDGCAAPGGKSFAAAFAMENCGKIISCDIHPHKVQLLEKGASRLKISILESVLQDGRENRPEWNESMDVVIADVPCSGLGVIRKKPDIRYKDLSGMERLPVIQLDILRNLSRYVRPGGILLYSTCTILKRENEGVVDAFLQEHKEFQPEEFQIPEEIGGSMQSSLTLLPHIHGTDGFFICKLRRNT